MKKKYSIGYMCGMLAILCAICGLLLTVVNDLTAPIIAQASIKNELANLELIYPGATFTEVDNTDTSGYVTGVYQAEGIGYVYKINAVGYNSSGFTFLLAINNDGNIDGYVALEQQETSGFGARAFEDEYTNTITGLTSQDAVPLLSGATITSTAVSKGIYAAEALFNEANGLASNEGASAPAATPETKTKSLSDDYSDYQASCEISTSEGTVTRYSCVANGFGLIDPDGIASGTGHEYSQNEAEIVVDTESMSIVSVNIVNFGDTEGIGDSATSTSALASYEGKTLEDEVDITSSATYTSTSIAAMVQAALTAAEQ